FGRHPECQRRDRHRHGMQAGVLAFAGLQAAMSAHIDSGEPGRGPLQHGVFAGNEKLARGRRVDHSLLLVVTPSPIPVTITSRTPGTAARASRTEGAAAGSQIALSCGPASMVKNTCIPPERRVRTVCIASSVAPFQ